MLFLSVSTKYRLSSVAVTSSPVSKFRLMFGNGSFAQYGVVYS